MWHTMDINEVLHKLKTNPEMGLNEKEVEKRREIYGKNKIEEGKKESIFIKFLKQFNDFMIIILLLAAVISAGVSYAQNSNDYVDSIIIVAIVILNSIMGVIQEYKAEKSIEALKKMAAPIAKVKRNGKIVTIPSENVVPGDILLLEAGNFIPADCRLLNSFQLKVEEASLTGETIPVQKEAQATLKKDIPLGDMINTAFATTTVISGHAEAVCTEIGMNTKVGSIAKIMIQDSSPETPLQRKLAEVGKKLGLAAIFMCFAIFVIGIFKKIPVIEMFMTSIGLAVAAIPEGLPAVVTIMLSIGVTKMARKNAIIRKLPAVETLGSSQIICSDKTGTLTQNKMKVVEIANVSGNIREWEEEQKEQAKEILRLGVMCNDSRMIYEKGKPIIEGEPTENAIMDAGIKLGENKETLYEEMKRVGEIPFESERKMMTTIHKIGDHYRIITKGAPDILLKRCTKYEEKGLLKELGATENEKILKLNTSMAERALRVLAVAYKDITALPQTIESNNMEKDLVFVGLIGMIDPPRKGVKEAVSNCHAAGIKTVMITGDHILTAKAIAKELGIMKNGDAAITGAELEKMSQETLERDIMKYAVFARVSPEHKVRIVKAFRKNKKVVAMTGDGVNDAPALKNADIGVAMGIGGTDVAKNASDMILTDDNFVTIIEAVKEGRHIYSNIKKAIHFLIATNVGEIITIFLGLVLGLETPLLAIHLLWINLVTDSFPAIALGLEPMEPGIMKQKPIDSQKGIFADGMWEKIFTEGAMIGILTLVAFSLGNYLYGLEVGRTMAFLSLGLLELVHSFNIRSEESIFKIGIFHNRYLVGAFLLGALLQIGVAIIPQIAMIFDCVPLNITQWIYTILISISPIIIVEIQKKLNEVKFGKVVYENEYK